MNPRIQYIHFTGTSPSPARAAQKRLIRSHVATHRQRMRRQQDTQDHIEKTGIIVTGQLPEAQITSPTARDQQDDGRDTDSECTFRPNTASSLIENSVNNLNELSSVEDGGHLLPLPDPPSPYSYLGQGISDPTIPVPLINTTRMSRHIYYCTLFSFILVAVPSKPAI